MVNFTLNGKPIRFDGSPDMPLLWCLRDELDMKGTKFGCGIGQCGACTLHVDGEATRCCVLPVAAIADKSVTTIEGLSDEGSHPVQEAWMECSVTQCGYCQPGQIMQAVALLKSNPHPSDADIESSMAGNICRCGTYPRIRQAIHTAAKKGGSK